MLHSQNNPGDEFFPFRMKRPVTSQLTKCQAIECVLCKSNHASGEPWVLGFPYQNHF